MEKLKDLDKLTERDPRQDIMVAFDPSQPEGFRKLTAADRYADMAALELPESVPERVCTAFAVARTLWVYGWFYWPFFTLACFHAIQCLDLALAFRIAKEEGKQNLDPWTPPLRKMLERAIESNWITDEGIAHAKHLRKKQKQVRQELPEGMFGASSTPSEESPQRYCRILLETLPKMRDEFAHPKTYWHGAPGSLYLTFENVHGLIQQLFQDERQHHVDEIVKS